MLTFYSGYFRAALNGNFSEGQSGVIILESEEPDVFHEFVTWLYTTKARTDPVTDENFRSHCFSYVKLWIFADRRDIPVLMNDMIDTFQRTVVKAWKYPDMVVKEVYNNTTDGSALRRMLIRTFKCIAGENVLTEGCNYPKQFLFDLVRRFAAYPREDQMDEKEYGQIDMCPLFHTHTEGVHCTKVDKRASKRQKQ